MPPALSSQIPALLRELGPPVLGSLVRRFRDFAACEDALQEALLAASTQWPKQGLPSSPRGWLVQVAARRLTDQVRSDTARRHREELVVSLVPPDEQLALAADAQSALHRDDSLELLLLCCHPALSPASAIALTLRAVGGLTTAEIARAFLVPEATMAQRISRAKQTIRDAGARFELPEAEGFQARLDAVMHVLYLIFSEGYAASGGPTLTRSDLSSEAIRLTRVLNALVPRTPEVEGLLALMLLTDARRGARTGPSGELIPLDQQDRRLWDGAEITEGVKLVDAAFARGRVGPYQLQAAVAALHDEAPSTDQTDWKQILELYGVLRGLADNPMVELNHAIALAMVQGPRAGLERLEQLAGDPRLADHYRLEAVRAHLMERAGDRAGAVLHYQRAAARTASVAERDYLIAQAARLDEKEDGG
jgi:RNA polymerase sigma factor (sigma-70 family)